MKARVMPRRLVLTITWSKDEINHEGMIRAANKATEGLATEIDARWPNADVTIDVEMTG